MVQLTLILLVFLADRPDCRHYFVDWVMFKPGTVFFRYAAQFMISYMTKYGMN